MTHDKDKILIRAKDVTLVIAVLTMLGMFIGPMKKIFLLDETIDKVNKLQDMGYERDKQIAIINTQYADIEKQLEQMNWQLRKLRN